MKDSFFKIIWTGFRVALLTAIIPAKASVNVTQHHNNPSRDGLYVVPAFTQSASASLTRDTNFNGAIVGNVYSQPLYVEGGPSGPMVIVATQSNNVYALNATTGAVIWQRNVGTPITSGLPCGNINPLGVTGTPIVDIASRSLFLDAEVNGIGHQLFSLNVDTGAINAGWPVTLNTAVAGFDSSVQSQRAALGLVGNILYAPYGGRFGDCGSYRGRLVGVQISNPAVVMSFATTSTRAGIWGPGGVSSDGTNTFVTTGNGGGGATWNGSEAVIRLQPGPVFSGATSDYWAPTNWAALDGSDTDLGGSGAIVVDVPGATPSALLVALGKDGNAYLINRNTMGGVSLPVGSSHVGSSAIIQAAATYRTAQGTYVVFRASGSVTTAFKITAANPPTIAAGWSITGQSGRSSPFVTSTDGTNEVVVWVVGAGGDQRLHGYNGDTGAVVFSGGGANELMTGTRGYNVSGIAARGRIYVANDNKVYAFKVPVAALQLSSTVSRKIHGGAGTFDIPLPGVECRSSGGSNDYSLVFTFSNNLESGNASVTSGTGGVSGSPIVSGNTLTVNLTGVTTPQTLTVTLSSVTDQFLQVMPDTPVSMSVLVGDTSNNNIVNATDIVQTKGQIGQTVTTSNFRTDVNANGAINGSDVSLVKAHSGESVSAPDRGSGKKEQATKSRSLGRVTSVSRHRR
ncbi:MAG: dockerin type I domain-containing protein [Verrucomicrobiota bacterium]